MVRGNVTWRPHQDNSMHQAAGLQGKKAEKSKQSCIADQRPKRSTKLLQRVLVAVDERFRISQASPRGIKHGSEHRASRKETPFQEPRDEYIAAHRASAEQVPSRWTSPRRRIQASSTSGPSSSTSHRRPTIPSRWTLSWWQVIASSRTRFPSRWTLRWWQMNTLSRTRLPSSWTLCRGPTKISLTRSASSIDHRGPAAPSIVAQQHCGPAELWPSIIEHRGQAAPRIVAQRHRDLAASKSPKRDNRWRARIVLNIVDISNLPIDAIVSGTDEHEDNHTTWVSSVPH